MIHSCWIIDALLIDLWRASSERSLLFHPPLLHGKLSSARCFGFATRAPRHLLFCLVPFLCERDNEVLAACFHTSFALCLILLPPDSRGEGKISTDPHWSYQSFTFPSSGLSDSSCAFFLQSVHPSTPLLWTEISPRPLLLKFSSHVHAPLWLLQHNHQVTFSSECCCLVTLTHCSLINENQLLFNSCVDVICSPTLTAGNVMQWKTNKKSVELSANKDHQQMLYSVFLSAGCICPCEPQSILAHLHSWHVTNSNKT